ncbi:hypothetical protein BJ878DRAFT_421632, partial [Calycina marina]
QLFVLARAMLRKASILVLVEDVSSSVCHSVIESLITGRILHHSVDRQTNQLMQSLIRSEFEDNTIICVEHHLENILDYNKVAILDGGTLIKDDSLESATCGFKI